MRYAINKTNYRAFDRFSDNRLAHRSYFIPFRTAETMYKTDFLTERSQSDAVLLLSGVWDFAYYKKASMLKQNIDTGTIPFDQVSVPSTWQKTGYDRINYLNSMYPFRCTPPKTPRNCPAGVYRKNFSFKKQEAGTYFITFLGVGASVDVYMNGKYVGYGEGSHNSQEFDITAHLNDGENELLCVVYKWSTGTYLECQDMFRENGIFRDVYITKHEKSYIFDFDFKTEKQGSSYSVCLLTDIRGRENSKLQAELLLDGQRVAKQTVNAGESVVWNNLAVQEWNAEKPVCYDLVLTLFHGETIMECVRHKVGFKTIQLDGCRYLLNGRLIKLKGVNHHDAHPVRGYAMTAADLLKDTLLMKAYNVNCVRTSHYPPDPLFMTMCDVYGLYVVDEADIETHGCYIRNIDLISDDPRWEKHYLDRVEALYERDKNHASVVMWSMGNEAGGIHNFDVCCAYLHSKTTVPVHYEPACRSERIRYDILAHFYTPPEEMRQLSLGAWKDPRNYDAPFFLCEYAHSMGVGPGGLHEYWDVIYSDERFLGGCIWEWADHAHYDESAKYKYTYGGDHGDRRNSGNFCCDGLFYPDRTPSPSALCMKNVYSPLRAALKDGKLFITNTNRFLSSEGTVISYYFLINGEAGSEMQAEMIIAPGHSAELPLPISFCGSDDVFVILNYRNSRDGSVIAREQVALQEAIPDHAVTRADIKWNREGGTLSISKAGQKICWDKNGLLSCLSDQSGNKMLADSSGFAPLLYQAVIDNHAYAVAGLKKAGLPKLSMGKGKIKHDDFLNTVSSSFGLYSGGKKRFQSTLLYQAISENKLRVSFQLTSLCKKPLDMLQIGLVLQLCGDYSNVKYYGMGETESYSDFFMQDVMGVYETTADNMYVKYIKPQESGNRSGVRWAEITGKSGSGIRITALKQPLNFKAVNIDEDNLRSAKHMEDVQTANKTVLHINGFMRGIGSQSCGPDTAEQYKKHLHLNETYTYSFEIEII